MGLFWKRSRGKTQGKAAADTDQAAQRLAFKLLAAQRHLADRVNARIRKVKAQVLLVVLVSVGLVFGIYCLYLVLSAFF